ncbi:cyclodeaminase/cyclohydrolase family protein [Microbacterium sp. zg.B48]|uniref:cyclodeaminase/cyclohydrolase family protein n=1 Tax=Microbacterium sp. zg.B48 TaxID=2969408 RepID=UPI00214AAA42|nr:cyclodeaminase/cyclohydrolase family protein [Microbacterium sp. zg.B48]MCR2763140.1 cyclodeaminase/cyclohydrolase family protein [Microbacterium sp. zg.B48]
MDDSARIPASTSLSAWLDKLAQPDGAPGGGAACGVMLALSAALLRMVAEYTPDDDRATACAARLVDRRLTALDAAEADGVSSAELGAALRVPGEDPARDDRVRDAAIRAAQSSGALGAVGVDMVDELRLLREIGNPHLAADLAVAGEALTAGIAGASINLRANLQLAGAHGGAGDAQAELEAAVERMRAARDAASGIADETAARYEHR